MSKRKYRRYILNANFGRIRDEYTDYFHALSVYGITNKPKTLYGVDWKGTIKVILSQG